ncbi:MAG: TetR/AcrR family transcriptional regulator [Novosphingobium sp.]|jgi:AcrR family transcriptional regulator|nr:TetR/AcrR family transcriptional regulator [Novosphingobium sp.]
MIPAVQEKSTLRRRSRGRPKLEDVAQIESRLLDIALKEFLAHGYGGTSLTRIVKAAGISKTTLYTRFASKDELFRAIIGRQIDRLSAVNTLRSGEGALDLACGLRAYGNRTLEISLEGDLLQVNRLIYSESGRFPELGLAAAERSQRGIADVADFITGCAAADNIPCRDPQAIAGAFIFMLRGWYVDMLLTNRPVSAGQRRRWVDTAVDTLLAGRAEW